MYICHIYIHKYKLKLPAPDTGVYHVCDGCGICSQGYPYTEDNYREAVLEAAKRKALTKPTLSKRVRDW